MTHGHTFWFLLICACVIWYSTITLYVAIKGSLDIRKMLEDLRRRDDTAKSRASEQITDLSNTKPTNKKP
jgi:hypothetical protein